MNKAVFLDRDGTMIRQMSLVKTPDQLEIFKNTATAIRRLNDLGFHIIVITNQPQIAKNNLNKKDVENVNRSLVERMRKEGAIIDATYYCPHHPETHHKDIANRCWKYRIRCDCRKPNIGMLLKAKKRFNLDFSSSYIIGDMTIDMKTGENAKIKKILVKTGYAGKDGKYEATPDFIADDLLDASRIIGENEIVGVILAGGKGERMGSLTAKTPKPMLKIRGKPIIEHQINMLRNAGIKDIVICGCYLFKKIRNYLGNGSMFGVRIRYCEEKNPMDTGGALKNAEKFVGKTFVLLYGDTIARIDLKRLLRFHNEKDSMSTVVVHTTDHPEDSDLVKLDFKTMRITKMYRNKNGEVDTNIGKSSIYILDNDIFRFVKAEKHSFHKEDLPKIIKSGKAYGYYTNEFIKDIGTPERYLSVKGRMER